MEATEQNSPSSDQSCNGSRSTVRRSALWLKANWTKCIEVFVFICVVIVVWSIFAVPTVFYAHAVPLPMPTESNSLVNGSYMRAGSLECGDHPSECSNASDDQIRVEDELTCAEGFYAENVSHAVQCVPHCGYWLSSSKSLLNTVIEVVCAIVSVAAMLVFFVLAFWLQRDTLLVYPSIYLVFICVTIFISSPITLVAQLKKDLFCRSDNLLATMEKETPFCTLSGVVQVYALAQVSLWILFHALGIFRGVGFPFMFKRLKAEGNLRYVIISTVLLVLLLPIFPALLPLIHGHRIFPATVNVCRGRNIAITYFTFILPLSIFFALTTTVLIAIFWKVFKEFVVKQRAKGNRANSIRKAQAKILLLMCYYVTVGVVTLTGNTIFIANDNVTIEAFRIYFLCQRDGVQAHVDCGQPPGLANHTLALLSLLLTALLPCVILLFVVKCACTRKQYKAQN